MQTGRQTIGRQVNTTVSVNTNKKNNTPVTRKKKKKTKKRFSLRLRDNLGSYCNSTSITVAYV